MTKGIKSHVNSEHYIERAFYFLRVESYNIKFKSSKAFKITDPGPAGNRLTEFEIFIYLDNISL